MLINENWLDIFHDSYANFLPPGISDHTPVVVTVMQKSRVCTPFRFLNVWSEHEQFINVVTGEEWTPQIRGSPMFILVSKLKQTKKMLKKFHRDNFGGIHQRVKEAYEKQMKL